MELKKSYKRTNACGPSSEKLVSFRVDWKGEGEGRGRGEEGGMIGNYHFNPFQKGGHEKSKFLAVGEACKALF